MRASLSSTAVAVGPVSGGRGLFTTAAVRAGETVFEIEGEVRTAPDRFSIQVGEDRHLHPAPEELARGESAEAPWWFLNHACRPSVRIDGRRVVACRGLDPGDHLTFDYDTTEWSIASPFRCGCGGCGGRMVRGYAHLDAVERARHADAVAPHLLRLAGHGHA
jgi:hypothetical protein